MRGTCVSLLAALLVLTAPAFAAGSGAARTAGEMLYQRGLLDGAPVRARRTDLGPVEGRAAACATCHRGSGLGTTEGVLFVPPVTGRALFSDGKDPLVVRVDRRLNAGVHIARGGLDLPAFSTILREGRRPDGSLLSAVMPRYELDPATVESLAAYLWTLSAEVAPGLQDGAINIATVLGPSMDPAGRRALRATLETYVAQRNAALSKRRHLDVSTMERRYAFPRQWRLAFWELEGRPETWPAQLIRYQQAQPVFALLSGGGGDWAPVEQFCNKAGIACWFPSVDATDAASRTPLALYFSAGSQLDARVIEAHLGSRAGTMRRVLVLHDSGTEPRAAVDLLRRRVLAPGAALRVLPADASQLDAALSEVGEDDLVVAWLSPASAARLARHRPPRAAFYWSTTGEADSGVWPEAWRAKGWRIDPLEREPVRAANLKRFAQWAAAAKLPLDAPRLQSEAWFAARAFETALSDALGNLHPRYLVERAQDMLSLHEAERVQQETESLMRGMKARRVPLPGLAAGSLALPDLDLLRRRHGTSIYPNLSLGPGQQVAAKGAYVVPLGAPDDAAADWIVPDESPNP
ncbi:MAG: hypothetical protein RLZZ393_699 [Pseudomonadota bacterium]|jgi:hypothetical protein